MRTLTMLLAAMAAPAMAAPEVIVFDASAPFDPATDFVDLVDYQPTAPDIRLSFFAHDPGGGSNAEEWRPEIIGVGWDVFGGNGLEVESSIGGQGYWDAGAVVGMATPGPWGVAQQDVFYGYGPDNYPLAFVGYEQFPFKDSCLSCSYLEFFLSLDEGMHYVGLRWEKNGQMHYGWAAFEVNFLEYPQTCIYDDGLGNCDNWDLNGLRQLGLRYVAAGYETEPDTPITTAGGLCPADMNFDAALDFFDLAEFLRLYNAEDPAADLFPIGNGDQIFNFYDLSTFISLFGWGCEI